MDMHLYFSDLKEEAQKRVLEFFKVESAAEMNYDLDTMPLLTFTDEDDDREDNEEITND